MVESSTATAPARGAEFRFSRTIRKATSALYPLLAVGVALLIWEWAVRAFQIPELILPSPSEIFTDLWVKRVMFIEFTRPTLSEVLVGFAVAAIFGILLGVLVSFSSLANKTVYPLLVSSQMVPKVAVAPIFIIWFGTGLQAKVLIAFLIAFFPIMVSTMVGLEAIEPDMIKLFRSMGAGRIRTFIKLSFPAALPNIFAGLKIGMTMAVVGAVVAEFVAADKGLGYYLIYANGQLDSAGVFASLFLLTFIGVVLYYMIDGVQRVVMPTSLIKGADPNQATL